MAKKSESAGRQAAKPDRKSAVKAWFKEMGIIIGTFLLLNSFVIASFEVPTGSMENEIMTGDFLLVNKFVFGGTTPKTIPLTNIRIPSFKLPALWKVERGDVIVFVWPGPRDSVRPAEFAYYLKRCVAVAGDTLKIINRRVYVNGTPVQFPRNAKFNSPEIKPAGWADPRICPKGAPFNEDYFGPLVIPRRGDRVTLDQSTYDRWETFIRREGHSVEFRSGKVYVDGNASLSYIVERDYVFGMGDNRDNSLDSRFWGFIPTDEVVGTPLIVYWSWDPDIQIFDMANKIPSIRWNRFGTLVK